MRQRALQAFKALHRARLVAFAGDERALTAGRLKINSEFKKNIGEKDNESIEKLIRIAEDSAIMLEKCIVQCVEKDDGKYEVKVRETTVREKNYPFPYHEYETNNSASKT